MALPSVFTAVTRSPWPVPRVMKPELAENLPGGCCPWTVEGKLTSDSSKLSVSTTDNVILFSMIFSPEVFNLMNEHAELDEQVSSFRLQLPYYSRD